VKFACQIVGPEGCFDTGPEVSVEAGGYEKAARAHIALDGPRWALRLSPIHVRVRRVCSSSKPRLVSVEVSLTSEVLKS